MRLFCLEKAEDSAFRPFFFSPLQIFSPLPPAGTIRAEKLSPVKLRWLQG